MSRIFWLIAGVLVILIGEFRESMQNSAPFQLPQPSEIAPETGFSQAEIIPVPTPSCHASTLAELQDGRLFCAWFGGTREGASDVSIYGAFRTASGWSEPFIIVSRETAQKELGRSIRKLGNPVLHFQDGKLHLFFVSVSIGGWSGSGVNHALLDENGKLIPGSMRRLRLSPFFNVSNLVRCPALTLENGEIALPIYHEFRRKFSRLVRLSTDGRVLSTTQIRAPSAIQPCVVPVSEKEAFAIMRTPEKGPIPAAQTQNGGGSWRSLPPLPVFNPDSSVALLRQSDGRFLLVGNPKEGRGTLNLWVSEGGPFEKWVLIQELENEPGCEFSYPTLIQGKDGTVHLSYTWKRVRVAYRTLRKDVNK
ncbi:MAG: sialidase family protein [Thermoguttaceae bacterium]|nr:sialidase family protein [Thermoguttaceae bacterium]